MTDADFIADRVRSLEEAVDYFSSRNKLAREHWVVHRFLRTLGLHYADSEVTSPTSDPPDVLFRNAQFEIKEIMDAGRPRHRIFKEALARARQATHSDDLLEGFTPKRMNPREIADKVHVALRQGSGRYAVAVRQSLDLLFYVNLRDCFFENGEMPAPDEFAEYGWRSVSAYENSVSLVFAAQECSPKFISEFCGKYSKQSGSQSLDGM